MNFNRLFSEQVKVVVGLKADADLLAGTKTSDWVNMGKYPNLCAVLNLGDGTTGVSGITVQAGTDSSGSDPQPVVFKRRRIASGDTAGDLTSTAVTGFDTTAGGGDTYLIEVSAADLPDGHPWVAVKAIESVDAVVDGCLMFYLYNARYGGDDLPTAIA